jgi:hypothetical protein
MQCVDQKQRAHTALAHGCDASSAAGANRLRGPQCYLLDEDEDPPGPLDEAAPPPLMPPLLEDAPPEDDAAPPVVPPVPLVSPDELELEDPGEVGAGALDEEEEDPPGTTTVSFSFVVVEVDPVGLPPGTTVVVSFFSQPESARAPSKTNR